MQRGFPDTLLRCKDKYLFRTLQTFVVIFHVDQGTSFSDLQISIDLFLIRPDKPIVARKTLRHFALLAVDELVDVLDGFVQRAHFAIIDKEKYRCNYDEHHN